MAETKKTAAKKAAAPKKPVYENETYLNRDPSEVQIGFAEYIEKTTGHTVPVGEVALVLRLYPIYLKTPEIVAARDVEKAERERIKAVKEAERKARLQAKLDKIEESRAKLLAELGLAEDAFEEPEVIEPEVIEPEEKPVDLAEAKREKARRLAAEAAAAAEEPEAAWEGDDDFAEDEAPEEPITLVSAEESEDEGLWDEDTSGEEDF